jgi:UDP-N-acetylmuramate--alanine ligase
MDADHLDIYGDAEKLNESFREFTALVPDNGKLFIANGLDLPGTTVGVKDDAAYSAINVR